MEDHVIDHELKETGGEAASYIDIFSPVFETGQDSLRSIVRDTDNVDA